MQNLPRWLFLFLATVLQVVMAPWLVNNLPNKADWHVSDNWIIVLTVVVTIAIWILNIQASPSGATTEISNRAEIVACFPIVVSILLFGLLKTNQLPNELTQFAGCLSLALLVIGSLLPASIVFVSIRYPNSRPHSPSASPPTVEQRHNPAPPVPPASPPQQFVFTMPASLDPEILKLCVEILGPFLRNESDRRPFFLQALGSNIPVLNQIEWRGSVDTFVIHAVEKLFDYGELPSGQSALSALLEGARTLVGTDVQQRIDTLQSRINL